MAVTEGIGAYSPVGSGNDFEKWTTLSNAHRSKQ